MQPFQTYVLIIHTRSDNVTEVATVENKCKRIIQASAWTPGNAVSNPERDPAMACFKKLVQTNVMQIISVFPIWIKGKMYLGWESSPRSPPTAKAAYAAGDKPTACEGCHKVRCHCYRKTLQHLTVGLCDYQAKIKRKSNLVHRI